MRQHAFFVKFKEFFTSLCTEKRCLTCHIPFVPPMRAQASSAVSQYLCEVCALQVKRPQYDVCSLCGHVFFVVGRKDICITCHQKPPPWNSVRYFGSYEGALKDCLLKFKFNQHASMLPFLSDILYEACASLPPCHMMLPMPRHQKRLIDQGFNHTLELCRPVARRLQIPLYKHMLLRCKATTPQSRLSAKARKNNPAHSFAVSAVWGKIVLLVDDIMTTGATLHHASLALRAAGAHSIHIVTIGRVIK